MRRVTLYRESIPYVATTKKETVRMRKLWIVFAALCIVTQAETASADGKGTSMLSIGLGQGVADGYSATTVGTGNYLAPTASPETNVGAEFWYLFSDDYAIALSGAYGFSSQKWEGAASTDPDVKASGTSIKFRAGADCIGKVGDRLRVFLGPGLEFWTGDQKLTVGSSETESESTTRIGVSGRIGGFMMLAEKVGIMGQVGHTFGRASVEDGAKSTWMPSSFNASWGLTLVF